ncbi:MAG TPA: hypothetical protein VMV21_08735, partial [Vicinamibacteria bacterium]|nr:hypothetical protein [Vicinamibacteria bacterium]
MRTGTEAFDTATTAGLRGLGFGVGRAFGATAGALAFGAAGRRDALTGFPPAGGRGRVRLR